MLGRQLSVLSSRTAPYNLVGRQAERSNAHGPRAFRGGNSWLGSDLPDFGTLFWRTQLLGAFWLGLHRRILCRAIYVYKRMGNTCRVEPICIDAHK